MLLAKLRIKILYLLTYLLPYLQRYLRSRIQSSWINRIEYQYFHFLYHQTHQLNSLVTHFISKVTNLFPEEPENKTSIKLSGLETNKD